MDFAGDARGWSGATDDAAAREENMNKSVWLWGRMSSCARVVNPRRLRRLAIGAQVANLPHILGRCGIALVALVLAYAAEVGIFEQHRDVGETPKEGAVEFNADTGNYRVTGGGANIWAKVDAFQFAWRKISEDVVVTADVRFVGTGAVDHRKAVLMIRQYLDRDSAYADVALHGDGLTSLQYRPVAGAETLEQRSSLNMPTRIRIARRGNQFTMYAAKGDEEMVPTGPATVVLEDPVYVGIGVCSHDANVLETAIFSNVRIETATTTYFRTPGSARARTPQATVPAPQLIDVDSF
jgi:hypothetical protein